jgi:hypothetical protein
LSSKATSRIDACRQRAADIERKAFGEVRIVRKKVQPFALHGAAAAACDAPIAPNLQARVPHAMKSRFDGSETPLLPDGRNLPYRENFLYFSRCGMTESVPSRRILSAS